LSLLEAPPATVFTVLETSEIFVSANSDGHYFSTFSDRPQPFTNSTGRCYKSQLMTAPA
jgi:hypothetical protein